MKSYKHYRQIASKMIAERDIKEQRDLIAVFDAVTKDHITDYKTICNLLRGKSSYVIKMLCYCIIANCVLGSLIHTIVSLKIAMIASAILIAMILFSYIYAKITINRISSDIAEVISAMSIMVIEEYVIYNNLEPANSIDELFNNFSEYLNGTQNIIREVYKNE